MELKYIFLFLSIVVLLVIFYKQYQQGQFHRFQIEQMTTATTPSAEGEKDAKCKSSYDDSKDLPLKEYCVKSSFNSAYDGTSVSKLNILKRIEDGYRFIDLNVFSASGDVYVGYSPDNAPVMVENTLKLSDALKCIAENAFSSTTKFNKNLNSVNKYPVFVHLRVYRPVNSATDIISNVMNVVNGLPGSNPPSYSTYYLRNADNSPVQLEQCTPLSSIMGKMLFSMDVVNVLQIYAPSSNNVNDVPSGAAKSLRTFVNILTGGGTMPAFYRYTEPVLTNGKLNRLGITDSAVNGLFKSNVKSMYIVYPHPDDKNNQPDVKHMMLNCSIQFIPMRSYLAGTELDSYVKLFDTAGTPMIPMSNVYTSLVGV